MELEEPMSEVQMSPDQIVEAMPEYLIPEKAATTKATIQFDLSGDAGGKWWVRINDGKAESGKGDPGEQMGLGVGCPWTGDGDAHGTSVMSKVRSRPEGLALWLARSLYFQVPG